MVDERIKKLAKGLTEYSINLQKGENVLIHLMGAETYGLGNELVKQAYEMGANPILKIEDSNIKASILKGATKDTLILMKDQELSQMKQMDAYIAVSASGNITNLSHISKKQMEQYEVIMEEVLDQKVYHTKWAILRFPTTAMAQLAGMNNEEFEDFYFQVCNLDYAKMRKAMEALVTLMNKTDKVQIKGKGTDLTFSIKGMGANSCSGEKNIPDGEVYTAPIKDSVNGVISYHTPSTYRNFTFQDVVFEFKDGKIMKATANDTEKINQILDTDEGARYIGEFALGVNPYITRPMNDILFDKKISGSFHFTPGCICSEDIDNGNRSAIHWDLVCIQTPEYGGGEIYFDDVLIRKEGRFVLPSLQDLNPENLK